MRASQRVRIISAVAEHLDPQGWALADLVLEQFGIVPDDDSSGDVSLHVHRSLADADPAVLTELAEHFDVPVQAGGGHDPGDLLWRPMEIRLFISHVAAEKKKAKALSRAMDEHGITSFVAHVDIHPSLEWQQEIERALRSMDAMVAMVTPEFPQSRWTDQEVGFALGRGLLVIPIQMGLDPYGFFGKHQAIHGSGRKADEIASDVFDALVRNPLTQSRMTGPVVDTLVRSTSYREAEASAERLLQLARLSRVDLQRIEAACLDNRQIYDAAACPDLISRLYRKHGYVPDTVPGKWEEVDVPSPDT